MLDESTGFYNLILRAYVGEEGRDIKYKANVINQIKIKYKKRNIKN